MCKHRSLLLGPWQGYDINQINDPDGWYLLFRHHAPDDCGRKIGKADLTTDMPISQLCIGRDIADRVRLAGFQLSPPSPKACSKTNDFPVLVFYNTRLSSSQKQTRTQNR